MRVILGWVRDGLEPFRHIFSCWLISIPPGVLLLQLILPQSLFGASPFINASDLPEYLPTSGTSLPDIDSWVSFLCLYFSPQYILLCSYSVVTCLQVSGRPGICPQSSPVFVCELRLHGVQPAKLQQSIDMSGFSRRIAEGHDNYLVNQQIALPISYSHADSHDFSSNGTAPHHFSQQTFGSYAPQIGPAYTQAGLPTSISQSPMHSIPVAPEDEVVQPRPAQCARQARYLQSPRYLPLREAISEIGIESQESLNENTMLSEPVIPPLEGFPSVREFDQLIRW